MRLTTVICGLLLAGDLVFSVSAAQRPTIPEIIEKNRPNTPMWAGRVRELAPRPLEEAVATSDLIVVASLRKLRTYLSADETELYTDFQVLPTRAIAARSGPSTSKPGAQTIVLRQWGGMTTINGVKVEIQDQDLPLLPTDTALLLLLTFNTDVQKYEVFGVGGAYALEGGRRLKHLASTPLDSYQRFQGLDVDAAVLEIRRLGR